MKYSNDKSEFKKELNEMIGFLYSDNKAFKELMASFCKKHFNAVNEVEINSFLKELEDLKEEENFTPEKKKEIAAKLSVFSKFLEGHKEEKISLWRRFVNFILSLFRSNPKSKQAHNTVEKIADDTVKDEVEKTAEDVISLELDKLAEALKLAIAEVKASKQEEEDMDNYSIYTDLDSEFDDVDEYEDIAELKNLFLTKDSSSPQAQEIIFKKIALALAKEFPPQTEASGYEEGVENTNFSIGVDVGSDSEEAAQAADATELKHLLSSESSLLSAEVKDFIFKCLCIDIAENLSPQIEVSEPAANEAGIAITQVSDLAKSLEEMPVYIYAEMLAEIPPAIYAVIYAGIYPAIQEEIGSTDADSTVLTQTEVNEQTASVDTEAIISENEKQDINAFPALSLDASAQISDIPESAEVKEEAIEKEEESEVTQEPPVLAEEIAPISDVAKSVAAKEEVTPEVTLGAVKPLVPEKPIIPAPISGTAKPAEVKEEIKSEVTFEVSERVVSEVESVPGVEKEILTPAESVEEEEVVVVNSEKENELQAISTPEASEVPTATTEEENSETSVPELPVPAPTLYVSEPTAVKEIKLETVALESSAPTSAIDESDLQLSSKEEVAQEISIPESIEVPVAATEKETPTSVEAVEEKEEELKSENADAPAVITAAVEEETLTSVPSEPISISDTPEPVLTLDADVAESVETKEEEKEEINSEVTFEASEQAASEVESVSAIEEETSTSVETAPTPDMSEPVKKEEIKLDEVSEQVASAGEDAPAVEKETPTLDISEPVEEKIKLDEASEQVVSEVESVLAIEGETLTSVGPAPTLDMEKEEESEVIQEPSVPAPVTKRSRSEDVVDSVVPSTKRYRAEDVLGSPVPVTNAFTSTSTSTSELQLFAKENELEKLNDSRMLSPGISTSVEAGKQAVNESESIIQASETKREGSNARENKGLFVNKAIEYANCTYALKQAKKAKNRLEIKELIKTKAQELLALAPSERQKVDLDAKVESSCSREEITLFFNKAIVLTAHIRFVGSVEAKDHETQLKKLIKKAGKELLEALPKALAQNNSDIVSSASASQNSDKKQPQSKGKSKLSLFKPAHKEKSIETDTNTKGTAPKLPTFYTRM